MNPVILHAWLEDRPWPSGDTVQVLWIAVGSEVVQVWPLVPADIRGLGEKLVRLADGVEEGRMR